MQTIIITGNIGKDAETRQAGNDTVCSFNVGVRQGWGDKSSTNWFRCNVWGKRGGTIQPSLTKGTRVTIAGELTIGEYNGKPQYDIRVNEVDYAKPDRSTGNGGGQGSRHTSDDLDDDVPFATCDPRLEHRVS